MDCLVSLKKTDGSVIQLESEAELSEFMITNEYRINHGKYELISFDENHGKAKMLESALRLQEITSKNKIDIDKKNKKINPVTGETTHNGFGNVFHVSHVIENAVLEDGSKMVTPFDIEALETRLVEKFQLDGHTKAESKIKTKKLLNQYKKIGFLSGKINGIASSFFKNYRIRPEEVTKDRFLQILNPSEEHVERTKIVVDNLYKQFVSLEKSLRNRHGQDAAIIPSLDISAKSKAGDTIFSRINLMVFDNQGNPHIYLFKNTTKPDSEWSLVTNKRFDFELGFDRQMLAKHGFDVSKIGLNIIPFNIEDDSGVFDVPTKVTIKPALDRYINNSVDGPNRMVWEEGEIFNKVNQVIDVDLVKTQDPIAEQVFDIMADMIPNDKLERIRMGSDVTSIIRHSVIKSYDDTPGYTFRDDLRNETIKIETEGNKFTDPKVREVIEDYVARKANHNNIVISKFESELNSAITGQINLEDISLMQNNANKEHVINNIKKYTTEAGWSIFEAPNMNQLGIIVLRNNVTKEVDFITVSYLSHLNAQISSLGLDNESYRTTLAGMHLKDYDVDFNMLKATNGNIELIKTMVAINENIDMFEGTGSQFKIGEIKVINPRNISAKGNTATVASRDILLQTYNVLMRLSGHEKRNKIDKTMFIGNLQSLVNQVNTVLMKDSNLNSSEYKNLNSIKDFIESKFAKELKAEGEKFDTDALGNAENSMKIQAKMDILKDILERFERAFNVNRVRTEDLLNQEMFKGDVGRVYKRIQELIIETYGLEFHQTQTLGKYMSNGKLMVGTLISQPEHVPDKNFRNIVELNKAASTSTVRLSSEFYSRIFSTIIKPYWKEVGFSMAENKLIGKQGKLYENLYKRDNDGSINENLMFKNPYDTTSSDYKSMSDSEITLLKKALWEINKFRFNLTSEDSQEAIDAKQTEKWFWVPLTKATNRADQIGYTQWIKEKGDDFKRFKESFDNKVSGAEDPTKYVNSEYISSKDDLVDFEMYNRFEFSERSLESRDYTLSKHSKNHWELNLETLMTSYAIANIKKNQMNKVMPVIRAIKMMTLFYERDTNVNQDILNDGIDKFINSVVYGKNIQGQESQAINQVINKIKNFASKSMIGGNLSAIPRDFFSATWKALSLATSKMYLGKEQFGYSDLGRAMGFVFVDAAKTMSGTSLMEAINLRLGLSDIDVNSLHHKLKSNKSGLVNIGGKMFWTSTVGDYGVRMMTFVAKAMHDGTWDAFGYNDHGLQYDWKADKRFAVYHKGDKSDPEYHKQRSLYLSMLNEFNTQNRREGNDTVLKEGDALPFAYTDKEVISLKSFADMSYGFYSQDVRALHEKVFLGSLFFQFKTYLTTHFVSYFLNPGHYNQYEKAYKFDPNTGKQLYYKVDDAGKPIIDQNGNLIETTEVTEIPVTYLQQRWLQGIAYTLGDIIKDVYLAKGSTAKIEALKSIKNNPIKRSALVKMGTDMSLLISMGLLGSFLVQLWEESLDERTAMEDPTVASVAERLAFATLSRGYMKSFDDISYKSITSSLFNTEPATLGYMSNVFNTIGGAMTGKVGLETALYRLNSVARSVRPIVEEVKRVPKIESEIKEKKKSKKLTVFGFN